MKGNEMYVIPIYKETLDLITELNNGVRPEIQEEVTFFVWKKDEPADIVTKKELGDIDVRWTVIRTFHKD